MSQQVSFRVTDEQWLRLEAELERLRLEDQSAYRETEGSAHKLARRLALDALDGRGAVIPAPARYAAPARSTTPAMPPPASPALDLSEVMERLEDIREKGYDVSEGLGRLGREMAEQKRALRRERARTRAWKMSLAQGLVSVLMTVTRGSPNPLTADAATRYARFGEEG